MTVAFRDLTRPNFQAAWSQMKHRQLEFDFTADKLTLLLHQDKKWQIQKEFFFNLSV